jgi:ABC-type lipoprotein export system ATPase subunit
MTEVSISPTGALALLSFRGVGAWYGDGDSLFEGLDLHIDAGEIVALRGRSGAGKSTALAISMGMQKPTVGTVEWKGSDIYALDEAGRAELRRSHYGIVLQDGGLLHGLTALENVLVPVIRRRASRADRARALDALGMVGMGHRAEHTPSRMSGGESQRVAIARALFADPELLVIDEPTASLDRKSADSVIDLIVEVARDGRGVFVASHDPSVVASADRFHDIEPRLPVLEGQRGANEAHPKLSDTFAR